MRSAAATLLLGFCVLCGVVAAIPFGDNDVATGDVAGAGGQRVLFEDGFDGRHIDQSTWNTCFWWADKGCTIATNNELQWYLARQVRAGDGVLRLVATRRPAGGSDRPAHPFVSGMISSGPPHHSRIPKFAFRYGTAEVRASIPHGKGLWPAFWLLPASRRSKPEIDVMEVRGQAADTVGMNFHYRTAGGRVIDRGRSWTDPALASGWHTFAVDWRPGKLVWLIDGVPRWHLSGPAVPDERMYLVANLAVGGDWPGPPDSSTRFPTDFKLDYVKVSK